MATVCDGVGGQLGGCSERHQFTASTCDGLAREWATVLDQQIVAILNGPTDPDLARSVRLKQAIVVVTTDMNTHLRELGFQAACDVPEFISIAEPMFSADLRARVGAALYDSKPMATYSEWLDDVRRTLNVIDADESPSAS